MAEKKILITERIAQEGIDILVSKGYQVDVRLKMSHQELVDAIVPYDGLIVRSATKVDEEVLDAAENLVIIGRAGVTVDNIDIDAATAHGVLVCNAPTSNILSAAEETMALILACARKIPQANASMHNHEWERTKWTGVELFEKTLAIIGLGRIGGLVAERARAFGMRLIGYDPYCAPERAESLGVVLYENFDDVLREADVITVHLPNTSATKYLFGPNEYALMKDNVILINAARGDIFDMKSLADFMAAGKISAVGFDRYEEEPCHDSPLHEFSNAILTPHIAAVTKDAQVRAGTEIAEYVWTGLEGSIVPTALNASTLPPEVLDAIEPFVPACEIMGRMVAQILGQIPESVQIELAGQISAPDLSMLLAAALDGILSTNAVPSVTRENAEVMAARHGIHVDVRRKPDAGEYSATVSLKADGVELGTTLFGTHQSTRIVSFLGYKIDIVPTPQAIIFEYEDRPGILGLTGTILGEAGINITTLQCGIEPNKGTMLNYMNVEGNVTEEVLDALRNAMDLKNLWYITI